MKLIADCGSTKITWILLEDGVAPRFAESCGINPALLGTEEIEAAVANAVPREMRQPQMDEVWFYAAGCRSEREKAGIENGVRRIWSDAAVVAASDALGAARAVCGHSPGVACILGTGSNATLYSPDEWIVASTPPMGYVLGDEGSGADIGKALINCAVKRVWSSSLCESFMTDNGLTVDSIIQAVYRAEAPNRFLASLTRWAASNIGQSEVSALIESRFIEFLQRNVLTLPGYSGQTAGFVGSVAAVFDNCLRSAAHKTGVKVGKVMKSPAEGLIEFHRQ